MKFSIITPTYNHAALITRTVRSLQAQDYTRDLIEWILIDGGSSDQTLETIQPEKFHPDLWESQPNRGFFDALNRGLKKLPVIFSVFCLQAMCLLRAVRSTAFPAPIKMQGRLVSMPTWMWAPFKRKYFPRSARFARASITATYSPAGGRRRCRPFRLSARSPCSMWQRKGSLT